MRKRYLRGNIYGVRRVLYDNSLKLGLAAQIIDILPRDMGLLAYHPYERPADAVKTSLINFMQRIYNQY